MVFERIIGRKETMNTIYGNLLKEAIETKCLTPIFNEAQIS